MSVRRKCGVVKGLGLAMLVGAWGISCCIIMYWVAPSGSRLVGLSEGCFVVRHDYTTGRINHIPASRSVFGYELTLCLREWLSISVGVASGIEPRWVPAFDKEWSRSFTLMSTSLYVPLYIPLLPFGLLWVRGVVARRRRRRRMQRGLCGGCGYNLRGSREKCPECGDRTGNAPVCAGSADRR